MELYYTLRTEKAGNVGPAALENGGTCYLRRQIYSFLDPASWGRVCKGVGRTGLWPRSQPRAACVMGLLLSRWPAAWRPQALPAAARR